MPTGVRCTRGADDGGEKLPDAMLEAREKPARGSDGEARDGNEARDTAGDKGGRGGSIAVGDQLSDTDIILKKINELRDESLAQ